MLKLEFFLKAMKAEAFLRRAWGISAFAMTQEAPDAWKKEPYPYRIVYTATGCFFVDPDNGLALTQIEDSVAGKRLFDQKETVRILKGQVVNIEEDMDTTYGRLFVNFTVIIWSFFSMHGSPLVASKFPFQNKRISPNDLEAFILPRLKDSDDPVGQAWKGAGRNPAFIYVDEYLRFADAMFFLVAFTQTAVPAATPKSMVAATGVVEFRNKLIAENAGRLHDPTTIAKIDAELVKFDAEYLKGDLSEGFLITDKSRTIVRKKLFSMHGAEVGLSEGIDVELIQNSLSEGWDVKAFPAMNNSLRAGSFNRGAQTMLGGESVKWLLRASSNLLVTVDDCGSTLGVPLQVEGTNFKRLTGFHLVTKDGIKEVASAEEAESYVGKMVMIRSPMFCKLPLTDYCKICVGPRLAVNPTALSSAVSEYGSAFLDIYMAAARGKKLALAHMDYNTAIT